MPTALITGATAGIGAAFAHALAREGYDLVLVARDGERLAAMADELRSSYGSGVEWLPADLATDEGCARVEWRCGEGIDMLVNNAGLGTKGRFHEVPRALEEHLLRLNVRAVMRLAHAALPPMVARGNGDIINVSSVAGFSPGGTYSASKAWVTNFSESLFAAYAADGIRVLSLCPGFTRTEFHARAELDVSGIPARMWLQADRVAAAGLADLRRGRSVSVPGRHYKVIVAATRLVPSAAQREIGRRVRGRLPGR